MVLRGTLEVPQSRLKGASWSCLKGALSRKPRQVGADSLVFAALAVSGPGPIKSRFREENPSKAGFGAETYQKQGPEQPQEPAFDKFFFPKTCF